MTLRNVLIASRMLTRSLVTTDDHRCADPRVRSDSRTYIRSTGQSSPAWLARCLPVGTEHCARIHFEMEPIYDANSSAAHILAMYRDRPEVNCIDPCRHGIPVVAHGSIRLILSRRVRHSRDSYAASLSVWRAAARQSNGCRIH